MIKFNEAGKFPRYILIFRWHNSPCHFILVQLLQSRDICIYHRYKTHLNTIHPDIITHIECTLKGNFYYFVINGCQTGGDSHSEGRFTRHVEKMNGPSPLVARQHFLYQIMTHSMHVHCDDDAPDLSYSPRHEYCYKYDHQLKEAWKYWPPCCRPHF